VNRHIFQILFPLRLLNQFLFLINSPVRFYSKLNQYGLEDKIKGISHLHGKIFEAEKTTIIPFYHPAVATYNANMKKILIKDFQILKNF